MQALLSDPHIGELDVPEQLFSKIRSNPHYRPKKETAIAFAMSFELNPDDTNEIYEQ